MALKDGWKGERLSHQSMIPCSTERRNCTTRSRNSGTFANGTILSPFTSVMTVSGSLFDELDQVGINHQRVIVEAVSG